MRQGGVGNLFCRQASVLSRLLLLFGYQLDCSTICSPQLRNAGAALAVVSDAGTPGVSDPGSLLVAAAAESGIRIIPVPVRNWTRVFSRRIASSESLIT